MIILDESKQRKQFEVDGDYQLVTPAKDLEFESYRYQYSFGKVEPEAFFNDIMKYLIEKGSYEVHFKLTVSDHRDQYGYWLLQEGYICLAARRGKFAITNKAMATAGLLKGIQKPPQSFYPLHL